MDEGFMHVIEAIRGMAGFPFYVTSAYRCEKHDRKISNGSGAHTTGKAIDIAVDRKKAFKLIQLIGGYPITGLGVKQHGDNRFIHLDILTEDDPSPYPGRAFYRPTVWGYE